MGLLGIQAAVKNDTPAHELLRKIVATREDWDRKPERVMYIFWPIAF